MVTDALHVNFRVSASRNGAPACAGGFVRCATQDEVDEYVTYFTEREIATYVSEVKARAAALPGDGSRQEHTLSLAFDPAVARVEMALFHATYPDPDAVPGSPGYSAVWPSIQDDARVAVRALCGTFSDTEASASDHDPSQETP